MGNGAQKGAARLRSGARALIRSVRCQVADFLQQLFVVRHPLVAVANDAVAVDQVGNPAAAVVLADAAVVDQEREAEVELRGKVVVGLQ